MANVPCKLCEKKRARRHCPGIDGEICPSCCGAERENTIDCPLDCEFLREARLREQPAPQGPLPHADIRVTEDFLRQHDDLVVWLSNALARGMETARAVDSDAQEALDALIRTYRTLESGLIYETRPGNPYAARIQDALKDSIEELRKAMEQTSLDQTALQQSIDQASGRQALRDLDILGVLVFLERVEAQYANGRRRGRAFYDFLSRHFPALPPGGDSPLVATEPVSNLIR